MNLSRDGGPFVEFNLASPDIDMQAFQTAMGASASGSGLAFYDYPSVLPPEEIGSNTYTGVGTFLANGDIVTPASPDGYQLQTDLMSFHFVSNVKSCCR